MMEVRKAQTRESRALGVPHSMVRKALAYIETERRLDRADRVLSKAIVSVSSHLPGGQRTIDMFNGTYLGHPAHPLLTDLPIGAYTFAAVFDIATTGQKRPSKAATALIAMGLLSTVPTALAGALDWQHTGGKARRVGAAHAVLNSLASSVFALSLASRLTCRGPARTLNLLGNGILMVSGYLGGHLVYNSRVGVKYEDDQAPPEGLVPVMRDIELAEGALARVEAAGHGVVLLRQNGRIFALSDMCPHMGCSLAEGSATLGAIACGCHGSVFDAADGSVLRGPSAFPVMALPVEVIDGMIVVGAPRSERG